MYSVGINKRLWDTQNKPKTLLIGIEIDLMYRKKIHDNAENSFAGVS